MRSAANKLTLVLADDHPLVLRGLKELLATDRDVEVLAVHSRGDATLESIRVLRPDIAVLDVAMPGMTGLEILTGVRRLRIPTKVILLAATLEDDQIFDSVAAGVDGILMKTTAPDTLLECLWKIYRGGRWLQKDLIEPALARETERRTTGRQVFQALTRQEKTVASLVAEGKPNKVISRELGISEGTVKIHLHNIYGKLGVSNRTSLATLSLRYADMLARSGATGRSYDSGSGRVSENLSNSAWR